MSRLTIEIFKARTTLLEQLEALDYDVSSYQGFSLVEVNAMFATNQLDMNVVHRDGVHRVYVLFYSNLADGKQINTRALGGTIVSFQVAGEGEGEGEGDAVHNSLASDFTFPRDTMIIVSAVEVNESVKKFLKELWENQGIYVSIISLERLQFNVLKHNLVPPHRPLRSREEIDEIKDRYKVVKDEQFPTISRYDAAAMGILLKPGELCEILRPSKTAIVTPYYRMCVNKFE